MSWGLVFDARRKLDSSALPRFAVWNTMMGTSILSIPWGIKQVISPLNCFGSPAVRGWEPRRWCSRVQKSSQSAAFSWRWPVFVCAFRLVLLWGSSSWSLQACWCSTAVTLSSTHQSQYVSPQHVYITTEMIIDHYWAEWCCWAEADASCEVP